jgi:hypothetical protein
MPRDDDRLAPLSERIYRATNPGLKPWAVLYGRLRLRPVSPCSYVGQVAAKSHRPLQDRSANLLKSTRCELDRSNRLPLC